MTYDYFYGQQAEMFTFYRVPKVLFTEDCFWNVSTDAKLLYGILLDRMNLSARNGWLDEEGRVYIIFTILISAGEERHRRECPQSAEGGGNGNVIIF